ncbi:MAG: dTDP-4-dehydrorhamnose reductase [Chloroflexota bacterium]
MKILITGADGGVGSRLKDALTMRGHDTYGIDIGTLDITIYEATLAYMDSLRPDLVIHCAALTNVDLCAQQPDLAMRVNGIGTQNVALACQRVGAELCYLSTNEVFDGQRGTPYQEYDVPHPINAYGYSKWVGEQMIRDLLPRHMIVRTSWIFAHNGKNFLQKIAQAAADGKSLSVVTNEIGCPTYAEDLVEALSLLVESGRFGIYHLVNEGYTSRYNFARYILDCYGYADVPIARVIGAQYPRPSKPPVYSALSNIIAAHNGIRLRPWREAVDAFIERERSAVAK